MRNTREKEMAEEAEKQRVLAFKQKHQRPKRTREEAKKKTEEPKGNRIKLFYEAGNPPDSDELEMGAWLEKAEDRCRRVCELRVKLAEEKQRIPGWMENKKKEDEAVPGGWKAKAKTDLDSDDMPDLHDLHGKHGKHVWKCVEKDPVSELKRLRRRMTNLYQLRRG